MICLKSLEIFHDYKKEECKNKSHYPITSIGSSNNRAIIVIYYKQEKGKEMTIDCSMKQIPR